MPSLYEILDDAGDSDTIAALGREFGLKPQQTQAAVAALLPAISTGLKHATATPEGLGNLLALMAQQRDLQGMHGDFSAAFAPQGRAAGDDVLSVIFGSPDVSRAVVDQAQRFSGVGSPILKKLLPVLAGILISGLMGSKPSRAGPKEAAPSPSPESGGGLGDILGQIFGRGMPGSTGASPSAPPQIPRQAPAPGQPPIPLPTGPSGDVPGGDLLGHVLRELEQGLREGRIKPVIIGGGPVQLPMPGGQGGPVPGGQDGPFRIPAPDQQAGPGPSSPQVPGGDILGQILRDMLGGARGPGGPAGTPPPRVPSPELKDLSSMTRQIGVMDDVGAAVFGDRLDVGRKVEQRHLDNIQDVFDRFFGAQRR